MADVFLNIKVGAKDAEKTLNGFFKTSTKGFSKLEKTVLGLGAAVAGAFAGRKLISGINMITDAAKIQEDAINQLETALKLSGQEVANTSKEMQEFASSIQEVTRFGDEVILQNAALIQSLGGLDKEGLKKATQAAVDLSAALKIDLASAATLVGKAAAGEVSAFSRYGLIIKKGADNTETFANALDKINKKFGGSAAEQVKTYGGQVDKLSNSWGDFLEELGFFITKSPAVNKLLGVISESIKSMASFVDDNKDSIKEFVEKSVRAFLIFFKTLKRIDFKEIAKSLAIFAVAFTGAKGVIFALNSSAAAMTIAVSKWLLLTLAIGGSVIAIDLLVRNIGRIGDALKASDLEIELSRLRGLVERKKEKRGFFLDTIAEIKTSGKDLEGVKRITLEIVELEKRLADVRGESAGEGGIFATPLSILKDGDLGLLGVVKDALKDLQIVVGAVNKDFAKMDLEALKPPSIDSPEIKSVLDEWSSGLKSRFANLGASIKGFFTDILTGDFDSFFEYMGENMTALGATLANAVKDGAKAAKDVSASILAGATDFIVPGLGTALGPLFRTLADVPPEEIEKQAKIFGEEFGRSIPYIIEGLLIAIPSIVEALIDNLITHGGLFRIAKGMGIAIGESFVTMLEPSLEPFGQRFSEIVQRILSDFTRLFSNFAITIDKPAWIGDLQGILGDTPQWVKDIENILDSFRITSSDGSIGGTARSALTPFADGGVVPPGFPNDSFGANLTSGETVIPVKTSSNLFDAINNLANGGGDNSMTNALLARLVEIMGQGQTVNASIELNDQVLADAILQLDRQNARLTA